MKTVNNFEIEIKKSSLDISEIYSEINKLNKIKKEADEKERIKNVELKLYMLNNDKIGGEK